MVWPSPVDPPGTAETTPAICRAPGKIGTGGAAHAAAGPLPAGPGRPAPSRPPPTDPCSRRPRRHHRVHIGARPVHPAAFEPRLDHQLVRALHQAAADRVAGGLKLGVADLRLPL